MDDLKLNSLSLNKLSLNTSKSKSVSRSSGPGLKISVSGSQSSNSMPDFNLTNSGSFQKGGFRINRTWKGDFQLEDLKTTVMLGQGAGGIVYKAWNTKKKEWLALKAVSVFDSVKRDEIQKELQTLVFVDPDNEHVVGFFGAFFKEGSIYLALEYMEGGSLSDLYKLTLPERMQEAVLSNISRMILKGLAYLHKTSHTVHRDIKPSNILMNGDGQVKITDFGVSSKKTHTLSICKTFIGTITYMSPERLGGGEYSFSSDVWSFGLTLIELATAKFPFVRDDGQVISGFWELLNHLKKNSPPKLSEKDGFSPEICDFVSKCLQFDPPKRQSVIKLLEHDFIKKHENNKESTKIYETWYKNQIGKLQKKWDDSLEGEEKVKKSVESKLEGLEL